MRLTSGAGRVEAGAYPQCLLRRCAHLEHRAELQLHRVGAPAVKDLMLVPHHGLCRRQHAVSGMGHVLQRPSRPLMCLSRLPHSAVCIWGEAWLGNLRHMQKWLPVVHRVQHNSVPGVPRPSHRQRWAATNACGINRAQQVVRHTDYRWKQLKTHTCGTSTHVSSMAQGCSPCAWFWCNPVATHLR